MNLPGACLLLLGLVLAPAARADDWISFDAKPGPGGGKHVVFLSGDEEYRSEEGLPMLAKILSQRHGFKCTVLFPVDPDGTINPENGASLPGAAALDSADAIVMLLRFRHWPDEAMKHFVDAYRRGVPIVGLRTSTHAFQYPRDSSSAYKGFNSFGKRVLGEGWVSHWGRHKVEATRGLIESSAKDDPILRGVADVFGNSDVYEVEPPTDVKILLRGEVLTGMNPTDPPADYRKKRAPDKQEQGINDPMMPVAWTRLFANEVGATNRIFCTTMGAATDLENEGLRRLVVNAVYWGLGLDVPAKADVALIDEYKPTMYGFKGHRRGTKPDDYALGKATPAGSPAPPPEKKPESPRPATEQAVSTDQLAWPPVTAECKPWARWWWLGNAVDKPNVTHILEEFQRAGIGGVEVTPIYGAKGSEDRFIDFLSPKWMEMLAHTTAEAKRLGLGVDMATGTGWPFGGPGVSADDASAKVVLKSYDVAGGAGLSDRLPAGNLQCLRAVAGDGTQLDLTERVKDGRLDWTAPPGKWRLYAVVQQSPVQKVKRAAPGGVGNVLDPYSVAKLNRYLAGFDRAFADFRGPNLRGQFHDSFEYYGATWTDDFFAQFQKRRHYDLRTQLPALFGEGPEDTVARVKHDYRETISDLHLDYVKRWTEWCHAHGWVSRNQAHGGPGNLIDTYAAADIPEMEIYRSYSERQMPMMKLAASAAHLSGRKLASSESFTWLGEHFQVPLSQVKPAADFLFLSGINHIFFHGIPYSPQDAPWPGWQFYAAVNFGPGGGLWRDLPAFNAYAARCQSVLHAGRPSNDVLLYFPFHDFWQRPSGLLTTFATEGTWVESHPVYETAMTLWKSGYGFDMVSDRMLAKAAVDRHNVVLGGNHYRRVVVPPCRNMPPDTLRKLADLARDGAVVLFQSALPADVPGWTDLEKRRAELIEICSAIENGKRESTGDDDRGRLVRLGKGVVVVGGRLERALSAAPENAPGHRANREWMTYLGLRFVRRELPDGHYYFVTNAGEKPVENWVALGTGYASAVLMDSLSPDRIGKAATQSVYDGRARQVSTYLQLEPGESVVVRTFYDLDAPAKPWRYEKPAGEPVDLAGPWKVEFIEGGPEPPAAFTTDKLESWAKRDDPELQRFAGTARYAVEFDRPAAAADDWQLDLGRVCESARVRVNGRSVGTLFSRPFRVAVGEYLRPGKNTLEIEVTNLAANRVRDLDRRKVNWKYFYDANVVSVPGSGRRGVLDASDWPLRDSGLLGPVTLTPMKTFTPGLEKNP